MDEMNVKLSTKIMRNMVAKLLSKTIFNKTGYKLDISLNEIEVRTKDGKIYLHINADAESNSEELLKVVKSIGLD